MANALPFTGTIASGATLSSEINVGRSWTNAYLAVPSMTSNSLIYIQAAKESSGTYRRIAHPLEAVTAPVGKDFTINSATTSRMIPIPNGFNFYKVETSATMDSGEFFTIICSD